MGKRATTWVLIADGGQARVVVPTGMQTRYATLREVVSAAKRTPSHELGTDKPGRMGESASIARHAIEPRADPHEQAKIAFATQIAAVVNEASASNEFDRLILVAPPPFAACLRKALKATVRHKIARELPKDLTKVPDHELARHLDEVPR
jgi:protein required for attachment to host cells